MHSPAIMRAKIFTCWLLQLFALFMLLSIIFGVVLTFTERAFGPMGWGAQLTQWIGG